MGGVVGVLALIVVALSCLSIFGGLSVHPVVFLLFVGVLCSVLAHLFLLGVVRALSLTSQALPIIAATSLLLTSPAIVFLPRIFHSANN